MSNTKRFEWEVWIDDREECKKAFDRYLERKVINREQEKENLSRSHIRKTDYNLDFINFLMENGAFYDWIITGCYYSIYHAALALLSKKGYSSKNHTATLCALIYLHYNLEDNGLKKEDIELVAKSSLEKEEVSYFVEAKDKRETASYGVSEEFGKEEAINLKDKTIQFINKVRRILE